MRLMNSVGPLRVEFADKKFNSFDDTIVLELFPFFGPLKTSLKTFYR